jgi:DNA repair ATPase RecN
VGDCRRGAPGGGGPAPAATAASALVTAASHRALEDTLSEIASGANAVLRDLFPEWRQMSISMAPSTKGGSTVAMLIHYCGDTHENVKLLSGGELSRLSMALTISLAKVSSAPVVLLDECIGSLDGELRDSAVEAIRAHLPAGTTVIAVLHEAVRGHFDHVMRLDC